MFSRFRKWSAELAQVQGLRYRPSEFVGSGFRWMDQSNSACMERLISALRLLNTYKYLNLLLVYYILVFSEVNLP